MLKLSIESDLNNSDKFSFTSIPKHLIAIKKICIKDDSSIEEVIKAIEQDPGLTGFLIGMANTTYYIGQKNAISSIKEACIRMGLREVGNYAILYATSIMYEMDIKNKVVIKAIQKNIKMTKDISARALATAVDMKKSGLRFDPSEVQTTVSLYLASNLVAYVEAERLSLKTSITEEDIDNVCNEMREQLLHALLDYVGYLRSEKIKIIYGSEGELNWLDIVHAEIAKESEELISDSVIQRLTYVGLVMENEVT